MKKKPNSPDLHYGNNNVLNVAVELCQQLQTVGKPFCIIGGVAYQRWGEPRQTVDVDATIFLNFGEEEWIASTLLGIYAARIDEPIKFAMANRIVLLASKEETGIDISLGGLPFERRIMERSSVWSVKNHGSIRTCSAEDLVVLKAFANRPQDWIDIQKVIIRQGITLNRQLILQELTPLVELKEEPEILQQLIQLFDTNS